MVFDGQHWTTAQTQGEGLCAGGCRVGGAGKFGTFTPSWYGLSRCEEIEISSRFTYWIYYLSDCGFLYIHQKFKGTKMHRMHIVYKKYIKFSKYSTRYYIIVIVGKTNLCIDYIYLSVFIKVEIWM